MQLILEMITYFFPFTKTNFVSGINQAKWYRTCLYQIIDAIKNNWLERMESYK